MMGVSRLHGLEMYITLPKLMGGSLIFGLQETRLQFVSVMRFFEASHVAIEDYDSSISQTEILVFETKSCQSTRMLTFICFLSVGVDLTYHAIHAINH